MYLPALAVDVPRLTLRLLLSSLPAPGIEILCINPARPNPRKPPFVLSAVLFENDIAALALNPLRHRSNFLAGAALAVKDPAAILCSPMPSQRKISAAIRTQDADYTSLRRQPLCHGIGIGKF